MSQCETSDSKISSAPPTPPNTPRPSSLNIQIDTTPKRTPTPPPTPVSEKTLKLVEKFDTLDEEDLMSSTERLERADRTPIPHGTNIPPAGMEIDSDEHNDYDEK